MLDKVVCTLFFKGYFKLYIFIKNTLQFNRNITNIAKRYIINRGVRIYIKDSTLDKLILNTFTFIN